VTTEPIAIIGIGCLFPKSPSLTEYWASILSARDCISDVPAGHSWSAADYFDEDPTARDKTYCRRGGFLDKVPFDPIENGVLPNMLESVDTTQLLSLLVAREALRDAGINPDDAAWDREKVSCILGVTGTQEMAVTAGARLQGPTWRKALARGGIDPALAEVIVDDIANHFPSWTEQTFPGLLGNVVAGRIANRLDLGGTNAVVDAACASSLAAVQYAVSELSSGRSDLALTGGADTLNDIFMFECFTRTPAFSRNNDARPFDASADGILIGEGIAILALKRLEDARAAGNRIYAVLRGLGSSSDGRYKSIYAPNPVGQAKALRRAYASAGFGPETVEVVEAHGTGTRAGDAAEIEALTTVFREAQPDGRWCAVGTVKSQIGHTKSTAGAAGLVKAALSLYHRVLPPTARIERPNPKMAFERSPFYLSPRARPWVRAADHPRRAGVSAFGFGGSNFHAVLEEEPGQAVQVFGPAPAELFLFGGTAEAVDEALRAVLAETGPLVQRSRASLSAWKAVGEVRVGFVASTEAELVERVAAARKGMSTDEVFVGRVGSAPKIAFLFPGQGSQYVEMGRTLAIRHPLVRAALDAAEESFRKAGREPLFPRMFPPPAWTEAERRSQESALTATEWAQPAIGALSKGMLDLLASFGVRPQQVAGHSYGELVALHAAGAIDAEALWTASRVRGDLMAADGQDRGTMAAVSGSLSAIEAVLRDHPAVVLANRNHPEQGVISGARAQVAAACEALSRAGLSTREIPVSAAFHSPLVGDAQAPFRAALDDLAVRTPSIPVWSDATAAPYPSDPAAIRELLARQLASPVDFHGIAGGLLAAGVAVFVEVGPRGVLGGLVRKCAGSRRDIAIISLDRHGDRVDGDVQLKLALAALAAAGVPVDPSPLLAERPADPGLRPGSAATVWIAGANVRNPSTLEPPMPSYPKPPAEDGWAAIPTSGAPVAPPPPLARSTQGSSSSPAPAPAPGADLAALLATTRDALAAFQASQERTAQVHSQYLDGVAKANDTFAALFAAHARLLGGAAAPRFDAAMPLPAMPVPAVPELARPKSVTAPVAVPAAQPDPTRVYVSTVTTSISHDLPPIFDARAAVDGRVPGATAPRAATAAPGVDVEKAVFDAVSAKTGYPRTLLEKGMDLEADLGIDSIKRVEILSAVSESIPGLPELDAERTGSLRSLGQVVDAVRAMVGSPAPAAVPLEQPTVPRDRIVEGMLSAVAEKTGYPRHLLELGMDLEADLGIDSIKRVEILSAVQERVAGLPELETDVLAGLRSLGDVVDMLSRGPADALASPLLARPRGSLADPAALLGVPSDESSGFLGAPALLRPPAPPPMAAVVEAGMPLVTTGRDLFVESEASEALIRKVVRLVPAPAGQPAPLDGRVVATADRGGLAAGIVEGLRAEGVDAHLVDPDWTDRSSIRAAVLGARAIVHCAAVGATGEDLARRVRGAFAVARELAGDPPALFATVSALGGNFGLESPAAEPLFAALGGIAKTVGVEWAGCRALALDCAADVRASEIAAEIALDRGVVEVGLGDPPRTPVEVAEPAQEVGKPPLRPGELAVVSGGARGVTAAVAIELARRWSPAILLLGRSAVAEADPSWALGAREDELKSRFAADCSARGAKPSPRELNSAVAEVVASRAIRATIAEIEAAGSTVSYCAVDVRDAVAAGTAVREAEAASGPVRVLVHGAGILADKRIADKTDEQFEAVFSTKVDGLAALLGACDRQELRAVGVFSSIAGRRGNRGQVDYAAANEVISRMALASGAAAVRVLDWGPWEAGMVTPELARQFQAAGQGLVPLAAGATACVDELSGIGACEIVLEGRRPSQGSRAIRLSGAEGWLRDHSLGGVPVVPVAMVVEWASALAGEVQPGRKIREIRDLSVLKGILVPHPTELALAWTSLGDRIAVEVRSGPTVHYRLAVALGEPPSIEAFGTSNGLGASPWPHPLGASYRSHLFHGPVWQGIEEITGFSSHGIVGRVRRSSPAQLDVARAAWTADPLVLDAVFQLAVLWVREQTGSAALPTGFTSWSWRSQAPPVGALECHVEVVRGRAGAGQLDARLVDAEGRIIAELVGGTWASSSSLNEQFQQSWT
jgi:acyl transferase domain-containing protein/NADP-dependent 3-hydroxy acid dehydrogenase YdfG